MTSIVDEIADTIIQYRQAIQQRDQMIEALRKQIEDSVSADTKEAAP